MVIPQPSKLKPRVRFPSPAKLGGSHRIYDKRGKENFVIINTCLSGGMVDALDLGSSAPGVEVRVLSKAFLGGSPLDGFLFGIFVC